MYFLSDDYKEKKRGEINQSNFMRNAEQIRAVSQKGLQKVKKSGSGQKSEKNRRLERSREPKGQEDSKVRVEETESKADQRNYRRSWDELSKPRRISATRVQILGDNDNMRYSLELKTYGIFFYLGKYHFPFIKI